MNWIMCGFVLRACDETGCEYLIILHLKNIKIQFRKFFLLFPVLRDSLLQMGTVTLERLLRSKVS